MVGAPQRSSTQAREAIGRPDLWFHDLRRSFVTNARRRGVPESVVMRMSGHRTRNVFDRYNVVEDEDVRTAVKVIEAGTLRHLAEEARKDLDTFWTQSRRVRPGSTKAPPAKCW